MVCARDVELFVNSACVFEAIKILRILCGDLKLVSTLREFRSKLWFIRFSASFDISQYLLAYQRSDCML
jgi:ABC-type amino acid transport system permease subunit